MLRFVDQLVEQPVVGIRSGKQLSMTLDPIINPHKMSIEAFYVQDRTQDIDTVLFANDIREIGPMGLIVDSEDALMPMSDLIRLEEIAGLNFQLINKKVVTESGKRLGRVENYAVNDQNFMIEKIYARPVAIKTLSSNDFIISRRQIASVNNDQVVVKDAFVQNTKRSRTPSFNPLKSS